MQIQAKLLLPSIPQVPTGSFPLLLTAMVSGDCWGTGPGCPSPPELLGAPCGAVLAPSRGGCHVLPSRLERSSCKLWSREWPREGFLAGAAVRVMFSEGSSVSPCR